jgi:hypothetical protein
MIATETHSGGKTMSDIMNTTKTGLGALLGPENSVLVPISRSRLASLHSPELSMIANDVANRMLIDFLR